MMIKFNTKVSKKIAVIALTAVAAFSLMGCAAEKTETVETTETVEEAAEEAVEEVAEEVAAPVAYEFETFDGLTVVINEGNMISQEACEEPLEWEGLPADAEQLAPGRDCILFADAANYYVEDVTNKLVTIAFQELGDVIEEMDYAIFDNNVFTFQYDPEYFVVNEDEEYVTVSFYNEETQTAGSNTITFTEKENADAMEVAKEYAKQYGVDEGNIIESHMGSTDATSYSFTLYPSAEDTSENQTRAMACAVANGDNVIGIEILTHVEPDEGMDMFINDKIAEVLDTFAIN